MTGPLFLPEELDPQLVLRAYAMGVFPMADDRDAQSVYWVEPKFRGILPLEGFHLSRSLRKTIASDRFRVTADTAFEQILALCAESARDRPDTWINGPIERVFIELHRRGHAHSIECWDGDRLAGGLYGLALGRAFFGESMVTRVRDASKVALAWLVARLRVGGFTLLDCQFQTDHLETLGAVEISRDAYLSLLESALEGTAGEAAVLGLPGVAVGEGDGAGVFDALDRLGVRADDLATDSAETVSGPVSGKVIAQLLGQTS
ncbi:leucyl/phenylalanyl-tRNA--protein transferase [Stakelama tenebrarum]|uniref:Leucyl/phenylalanyl-tRNA--protein transferase n=1 Tax=Stakelama tenebrarum TaxID=2711215 RepID=A0A6G6Y4D9_9SPHN|nr:leucyl/phenylalanyl-tRNA--protein transferase [Sphingosinithalassobacter tenebrarum]QIG79792.1 leucyl/phenylalanyl-tRNA--protein transferase [Sphingosinithalassobacter tenebrarum]